MDALRKRLVTLVFGCVIALALAACGGATEDAAPDDAAATDVPGEASPEAPVETSPDATAAEDPATEATAAAGDCEPPPSGELDDITIGLTSFNSLHLPFLVASAEGLMEPYGINMTLPTMQNVTLGIPGVVSGSLQFAPATNVDAVAAMGQESDVVAVAVENTALPYQIIGREGISSLDDLAGATIGVNAVGASLDYLAISGIIGSQQPELLDQVNFINAGTPAQRVAGLSEGRVDAVGSFPPNSLQLLEDGFETVAEPQPTEEDMQITYIMASRQWIEDNRCLATRFMQGFIASMNWTNDPANREQAIAAIAEVQETSEEFAETTYDFFVQDLGMFPQGEDIALDEALVQNGLEYFREAGIEMPEDIDVSSIIDNSLVEAALEADPSLSTSG